MDDVPDRTIEDIERDEQERLARIARVAGGDVPTSTQDSLRQQEQESPMSGQKQPIVCVETDEVYPSVASLTRHLKVDRSTVDRALSRDGRIGDFTYRLHDVPAASATRPASGDATSPQPVQSPPPVRRRRSSVVTAEGSPTAGVPTAGVPTAGPQPAQGVPAGRAPRGKVRMVYIEAESSDAVLLLVSQLLRGE